MVEGLVNKLSMTNGEPHVVVEKSPPSDAVAKQEKSKVLDVAVSYNLLLGRPWIHAAKEVPSSLHQMVMAKRLKQKAWELPKPIPHLSRSFVKLGARKRLVSAVPSPMVDIDEELIERFHRLFDDVNMVEVGEVPAKQTCSSSGRM
uniref:Uncharacterized protein LOC104234190 n=1 Tax=Nicotiana sylvestris TaxID=4096 RepID=A0A1U7X1K5_NICSY|nr:PREDICTED: uncharacterized protein LOC104234190 [Nicotiana sylvestris]